MVAKPLGRLEESDQLNINDLAYILKIKRSGLR